MIHIVVSINGDVVGRTSNQHQRYFFDILVSHIDIVLQASAYHLIDTLHVNWVWPARLTIDICIVILVGA